MRRIIFVIGFCLTAFILAAQPANDLKTLADVYFENGKYTKALNALRNYLRLKPKDMDAYLRTAECYVELGDYNSARRRLQSLARQKNPSPEITLHMARVFHKEHNFKEAVTYYKKYINLIKDNHPNRNYVKHLIRQSGKGISIANRSKMAIAESLGEKVNSSGDDIAPIFDATNPRTLYFSSSRQGNVGGKLDAEGLRNPEIGSYKSDIYLTRLINGEWTATAPIDRPINTSKNDIALGFSNRGKVMYYYSGYNTKGKIYSDTSSYMKKEGKIAQPLKNSPLNYANGDDAFFMYNDSTMILVSDRRGGYGGKDLYLAVRSRSGQWSKPQNLGSTVNGPYDEVSPYLSKDGKTLFFSSNGKKSLGGFDIFKTIYNEETNAWIKPENLGLPINSACDEMNFILSNDGIKGYYSSNRAGGQGGMDIFVSYYKEELVSLPSTPSKALFHKQLETITDAGRTNNSSNDPFGQTATPSEAVKEYVVTPLFYDGETVITPSNVKKLKSVFGLMRKYPQLKLEVNANSDDSNHEKFRLFFSLESAAKLAQYLVDNGISSSRIFIKGCGDNYPVATKEINGNPNPVAKKLNNRINLAYHNTQGLPIKIIQSSPQVNKLMKSDKGEWYSNIIKGLSYKVQVASIKQMYDSDIIVTYPDAMIEKEVNSDILNYTVGLYKTYASAEQLRRDLERKGVSGAKVIPYVNGMRTSTEETKIFAGNYPDLKNFLRATGQY